MLILLLILLSVSPVSAASLIWDATADGELKLEFSTLADGPFVELRRIQASPPKSPLEPGKFGYYRLTVPDGPSSNVALFSLDIETGLEARLTALEAKVAALPTGNLKVTVLDADRIEVVGMNCVSLTTSGTGLKRIVTCKH
jgi:hypothetical protein